MCLLRSMLFLGCLHLGYGEAQSGDATDQEKLEGTWTFVTSAAGDNQGKEKRAAMRVIFKGDTISFVADGNKRSVQGTFTLAASENPKTMDITLANGAAKALTQAIYELDGNTLKLCHYLGEMASKERPKQFVADKQSVLGILKREEK